MSPTQIVAVAIRLFVVWQAVLIVFSIPMLYEQEQVAARTGSPTPVLFYFVAALLVAALLYVLWRFPMTISGKLLTATTEVSKESASPDLWLSMGCALMGLWLLVEFIPLFARDLMAVGEGYLSAPSILKVRLATDLPGVIIGLWLIFGAKGFRKLFWWARNAGRSQPDK